MLDTQNSAISTIFALALAMSLPGCLSKPPPFDEAKWRQEVETRDPSFLYAPHCEDGRFFNPWMPMEPHGFLRMLRWRLAPGETYTDEEEHYQPGLIPDLKARISSLADHDFIAWIGHGAFLIRLSGEYWLTDPILSERAFLPKRVTPPALSADDLKGLTDRFNILVTHNHYDHLDKATIRALPENSRTFVPLGLSGAIQELNKHDVTEMDWWQIIDCGNQVRLVCLPAQHWSLRLGQGRDTTLWASFLLITPQVSIFIGGDSGYFVGYKEIGRRYPAIDFALLPISAYHPRWFMHYSHMNVGEALDAFQDLGARTFIPTLWGAFRLGNEPIGHAALDLRKTMKERSFDPSRVIIMDIGQTIRITP
jgi:N-acyl-phosphatidylethanolamine-hydrolysing phospholipase D